MGIISTIVIGILAGWITGKLMRGSGYGVIWDLILGVVGAIVGGWLSSILLGVDLTTGFNLTTLVVAVIGSVIVVMLYRLITRRSLA
ncbi:MAG: GlsB/YeaQ/YmgE family stress response membrane protein [Roseiflexaceae bacterium]